MADASKKVYITNSTKISYKFKNGLVLGKRGVLIVDEKQLKELEADFMFKNLKASKIVSVSDKKPASLDEAGAQLAEKDEEIRRLREELAAKEKLLTEKQATSESENDVLDTEKPLEKPTEGSEPAKGKGKK